MKREDLDPVAWGDVELTYDGNKKSGKLLLTFYKDSNRKKSVNVEVAFDKTDAAELADFWHGFEYEGREYDLNLCYTPDYGTGVYFYGVDEEGHVDTETGVEANSVTINFPHLSVNFADEGPDVDEKKFAELLVKEREEIEEKTGKPFWFSTESDFADKVLHVLSANHVYVYKNPNPEKGELLWINGNTVEEHPASATEIYAIYDDIITKYLDKLKSKWPGKFNNITLIDPYDVTLQQSLESTWGKTPGTLLGDNEAKMILQFADEIRYDRDLHVLFDKDTGTFVEVYNNEITGIKSPLDFLDYYKNCLDGRVDHASESEDVSMYKHLLDLLKNGKERVKEILEKNIQNKETSASKKHETFIEQDDTERLVPLFKGLEVFGVSFTQHLYDVMEKFDITNKDESFPEIRKKAVSDFLFEHLDFGFFDDRFIAIAMPGTKEVKKELADSMAQLLLNDVFVHNLSDAQSFLNEYAADESHTFLRESSPTDRRIFIEHLFSDSKFKNYKYSKGNGENAVEYDYRSLYTMLENTCPEKDKSWILKETVSRLLQANLNDYGFTKYSNDYSTDTLKQYYYSVADEILAGNLSSYKEIEKFAEKKAIEVAVNLHFDERPALLENAAKTIDKAFHIAIDGACRDRIIEEKGLEEETEDGEYVSPYLTFEEKCEWLKWCVSELEDNYNKEKRFFVKTRYDGDYTITTNTLVELVKAVDYLNEGLAAESFIRPGVSDIDNILKDVQNLSFDVITKGYGIAKDSRGDKYYGLPEFYKSNKELVEQLEKDHVGIIPRDMINYKISFYEPFVDNASNREKMKASGTLLDKPLDFNFSGISESVFESIKAVISNDIKVYDVGTFSVGALIAHVKQTGNTVEIDLSSVADSLSSFTFKTINSESLKDFDTFKSSLKTTFLEDFFDIDSFSKYSDIMLKKDATLINYPTFELESSDLDSYLNYYMKDISKDFVIKIPHNSNNPYELAFIKNFLSIIEGRKDIEDWKCRALLKCIDPEKHGFVSNKDGTVSIYETTVPYTGPVANDPIKIFNILQNDANHKQWKSLSYKENRAIFYVKNIDEKLSTMAEIHANALNIAKQLGMSVKDAYDFYKNKSLEDKAFELDMSVVEINDNICTLATSLDFTNKDYSTIRGHNKFNESKDKAITGVYLDEYGLYNLLNTFDDDLNFDIVDDIYYSYLKEIQKDNQHTNIYMNPFSFELEVWNLKEGTSKKITIEDICNTVLSVTDSQEVKDEINSILKNYYNREAHWNSKEEPLIDGKKLSELSRLELTMYCIKNFRNDDFQELLKSHLPYTPEMKAAGLEDTPENRFSFTMNDIFTCSFETLDNHSDFWEFAINELKVNSKEAILAAAADANLLENCHWLLNHIDAKPIFDNDKDFCNKVYEIAKESVTHDEGSWSCVSDIGFHGFKEIAVLCGRREEADRYYNECIENLVSHPLENKITFVLDPDDPVLALDVLNDRLNAGINLKDVEKLKTSLKEEDTLYYISDKYGKNVLCKMEINQDGFDGKSEIIEPLSLVGKAPEKSVSAEKLTSISADNSYEEIKSYFGIGDYKHYAMDEGFLYLYFKVGSNSSIVKSFDKENLFSDASDIELAIDYYGDGDISSPDYINLYSPMKGENLTLYECASGNPDKYPIKYDSPELAALHKFADQTCIKEYGKNIELKWFTQKLDPSEIVNKVIKNTVKLSPDELQGRIFENTLKEKLPLYNNDPWLVTRDILSNLNARGNKDYDNLMAYFSKKGLEKESDFVKYFESLTGRVCNSKKPSKTESQKITKKPVNKKEKDEEINRDR